MDDSSASHGDQLCEMSNLQSGICLIVCEFAEAAQLQKLVRSNASLVHATKLFSLQSGKSELVQLQ